MRWTVPAAKHKELLVKHYTCTCPEGTQRDYNWRAMRVVDVDFEQAHIASKRRHIWYSIGCLNCGNAVLDGEAFGAGFTGYSLFMEAKALIAEYSIDVRGGVGALEEVYELGLRNETATEVRNLWDQYYPAPAKLASCPLLLIKSDLRTMHDCLRIAINAFNRIPRIGADPNVALTGILADAGRAALTELADAMFARIRNTDPRAKPPRVIAKGTYYEMPITPIQAELVIRCLARATSNAEELARHIYATYPEIFSKDMTEADLIRRYTRAQEFLQHFYRTIMHNLAHYCRHVQ